MLMTLFACDEQVKVDYLNLDKIVTAYVPANRNFYNEILAQGQIPRRDLFQEVGFYISTEMITDSNLGTKIVATQRTDSTFSEWIGELQSGKNYYIRAYGIDAGGKPSLGRCVRVTTATAKIEYITMGESTVLPVTEDARTAKVSGKVIDFGGDTRGIIEYGAYYWRKNQPEQIYKTSVTTESINDIPINKDFWVTISGLDPSTTYAYKVYARNNRKEQFASVGEFTSPGIVLPAVQTNEMLSIATTQCVMSGTILNNGFDPNVEYGFYFGTTTTPTERLVADKMGTIPNTDSSVFSYYKRMLNKLTTYYVQAFVKNAAGESKGEVISFKTMDVSAPILAPLFYNYANVSNDITATSVAVYASIVSDGGQDLSECGAYWGLSPESLTNKVSNGRVIGDANDVIKVVINGLAHGQIIYYRVYGKNTIGETQLSSVESISTQLKVNKWVNTGGDGGYGLPNQWIKLSSTDFDYYYEMPPVTVKELDGRTYRYYFLDRNLGASKVAESPATVSDIEAIGNFYTWGYSKPASVPSTGIGAQVNYGYFDSKSQVANIPHTYQEWIGDFSPAPNGYTIPSRAEWKTLIRTLPNGSKNIVGMWNLIRFGLTGSRGANGGALGNTTIGCVFARDPMINPNSNPRPGLQANATTVISSVGTSTPSLDEDGVNLIYNIVLGGGQPIRVFRKVEVLPTQK